MKVQGVNLNSANVRYNNANEETRVYDIEANASIQGQEVGGVDGGIVKKNGIVVANFSAWGNSVNPNFQGLDVNEMCAVLVAINDFVLSVKKAVSEKVIEL